MLCAQTFDPAAAKTQQARRAAFKARARSTERAPNRSRHADRREDCPPEYPAGPSDGGPRPAKPRGLSETRYLSKGFGPTRTEPLPGFPARPKIWAFHDRRIGREKSPAPD